MRAYVSVCATHSSVSGYNSVAEGVAWETMFASFVLVNL